MRIERMLAMVVILLNRKRISARELAARFEVSIRTVYRDIEAINLAGIPVVAYPGNDGGFGIPENYKIDRQLLTFKDMMAILSALKGVNRTLADRELDTAIEKISSLVPKEKVNELELRDEQLVIDVSPWGCREAEKAKLKIIYQTICESRLVRFQYRNLKGEQSTRSVEPITLLFKGYAWYLLGYCRLRADFRFFKLSRIDALKVLEEGFIRRETSYRDIAFPGNQNNPPVHLILRFAPEVRSKVEEYFDPGNIAYQEDGYLIIQVDWPEDEWLYGTILSYGEYVEVLEPLAVRERIRARAVRLCQLYH